MEEIISESSRSDSQIHIVFPTLRSLRLTVELDCVADSLSIRALALSNCRSSIIKVAALHTPRSELCVHSDWICRSSSRMASLSSSGSKCRIRSGILCQSPKFPAGQPMFASLACAMRSPWSVASLNSAADLSFKRAFSWRNASAGRPMVSIGHQYYWPP